MSASKLTPVRSQVGVKPLDVDAVIREAARSHGATVEQVFGSSRRKNIVAARHAVFRVLRDAGWSFPAIGALMHRDHSTVCIALQKGTETGERKRLAKKVWWSKQVTP